MDRYRCGGLGNQAVLAAFITILPFTIATSSGVLAQGITTASLRGIVRDTSGTDIDGAAVRVINVATGFVSRTGVRGGIFLVRGLATGGPYRVVVTKIGYAPQLVEPLYLSLGDVSNVRLTLLASATRLDTVRVSAREESDAARYAGGIGTLVSDSSLRRLPTLNRDMYDFVRLVPQVSTGFGLSAAGLSFRYNGYTIDGVSDRQLQGNNVLGGSTVGGKTISLEAVKEYQVLLSPYNVRYGDFAGMLVNAVTKSGTNSLHGSMYAYARNEQLARTNSFVGSSPYGREQFGVTLGGPIVRNRLQFFIAPEFQHSTAPAPGPYIGQKANASPALPVSEEDVKRFASILNGYGIAAGDGGRVTSHNPVVTLFGRLDLALPEWNSRMVFLENYSTVSVTRFTRPEGRVFPLSSNALTIRTAKKSTALKIFTQLSSSAFNELHVSYLDRPASEADYALSPTIQVLASRPDGAASVTMIAGPPAAAGGAASTQVLAEIADHVVLQRGSRHTLSTGIRLELFRYHAEGVRGRFGQWTFSSLDALAAGDASRYTLPRDFGSARARVLGIQPSAYVSDEWLISDRLSVTLGLRGDALDLASTPAYNPAIDSIFNRRTSDYPATRVQWSPRFGIRWKPFVDHHTVVRGGLGIFVAPPPLGWLLGPLRSNGAGVRTLTCGPVPVFNNVPRFIADVSNQPVACTDARAFQDGPVALVDRKLRMAETLRTSFALEQRMPWNIGATVEALYSKVRHDFVFVNSDLAGPQGSDPHGRVMYGTIGPFGTARPTLISGRRLSEVIDLRNSSPGYSWAITAQLAKPFSDRAEVSAAYTHSRSRDVRSLINGSAAAPADIWASGRSLAGRHDDLTLGISSFEIPHRVVTSATYTAPWKRWKTDFSLYYIGESGSPLTYGDSSTNGLGDLNADGTSANDPIYVPRDATNPSEITFAGSDSVAQGVAFEKFIKATPCLRSQRGAIMTRNSCRGPWINTSNASLRQSLPAIGQHDISLQMEVFNVLNLLNSSWGLMRKPNQWILEHVGQTRGSLPQPIFHFNPANVSSTQNLESGYQLQLSLRYSF